MKWKRRWNVYNLYLGFIYKGCTYCSEFEIGGLGLL